MRWSKEKEEYLLELIKQNANMVTLEIEFKSNKKCIYSKLHEMGFEGLIDARRVLNG